MEQEQRYLVPCARCGRYIELRFRDIHWPKGHPEKAVYICPKCKGVITDHDKEIMLRCGLWKDVQQPQTLRTNALYSPAIRFADVARESCRSCHDPERLKAFYEFWIAEPWREQPDNVAAQ